MTNPTQTRIINLQNLILTAPSMKVMLEYMREQQSLIDSLSIEDQNLIYHELVLIDEEHKQKKLQDELS